MNPYERERAECAADEEARADRRLRAWRHRHSSPLAVHPTARSYSDRIDENFDRLRKAG
jgi:hypothetical protein